MGLLSTIAGAVAGPLVGGLFGKSKPAQPPKLDLGHLVKEANDHGFNPLTVLRNGGAATSMSGGQPARLSSASFIADAMSRGFEAWQGFSAQEADAEQDALRTQLMQQELKNQQDYNKKLKSGNFGYQVPRIQTTTRQTVAAPPALGAPSKPDAAPTTVTNPTSPSHDFYVHPHSLDAAASEERYGDMAQEVTGGVNFIKDGWYNYKLKKVRKNHGGDVADKIHKEYSANPKSDLDSIIRKHAPTTAAPKLSKPKPKMRQLPKPGWMDEKLGGFHY